MKKGSSFRKYEQEVTARIEAGATSEKNFRSLRHLRAISDMQYNLMQDLSKTSKTLDDLTYVERVLLHMAGYSIDITPPS